MAGGFPNLWFEPYFWFLALGATFIKVVTSPDRTHGGRLTTAFCAIFFCMALSDALLDYLQLHGTRMAAAVVVGIALTGEYVAAMIVNIVRDPEVGIRLWRRFLGRKS